MAVTIVRISTPYVDGHVAATTTIIIVATIIAYEAWTIAIFSSLSIGGLDGEDLLDHPDISVSSLGRNVRTQENEVLTT